YVAYPSFESAYQAVIDSECDTCVLPIENSFAGDVGNVMDLVFSGPLFISQIYDMSVSQALLAKKGTKKEDIERVLSHPQALNQCSDYIERHHFQAIEYTNTAASAMAVHNSSDMNLGCIASEMAAELYDLEVIESNINSSNSNTTRFAVFSKVLSMPEKERKMGESFILVFTVANEAGALAKTLNIIGAHGFNMRNLRSRPMKSLIWNYYFFLELEGNINSADGEDMMHELKPLCDRLKLAGTYSTKKEL
ncbi:MAG: bifunctional chorismate mutase/prephenate dehydratase, partial [Bacteroidales bacterium]|nr:bifunctional chorismate mutase/prephenate dehydratase [Bacteroidales bacterium]